MARTPKQILDDAFRRARDANGSLIQDVTTAEKVSAIATYVGNRAHIRFLLAVSLAKVDMPQVDIRKPYTEIGTDDSFSGRSYDQDYIGDFVEEHKLPCNTTTAFLTPAFRNIKVTLTKDFEMVGRPKSLYRKLLEVLDEVYQNNLSADDLLAESIRVLLIYKETKDASLATLINRIQATRDVPPLSSEGIVTLIEQHIKSPNASRLPVLVVAAAYSSASEYLREKPRQLHSHNAADLQTGALGDIEITLISDDRIITSYEMKMKRVGKLDIDYALQKIERAKNQQSDYDIDNYIFITTDIISDEIKEYARSMYDLIGIEVVVLDCISFLRHFLHLFHRIRMQFLNEYQRMLIAEPESAVRQELKEVFITLRLAAESTE